jgi:hypothetical protein
MVRLWLVQSVAQWGVSLRSLPLKISRSCSDGGLATSPKYVLPTNSKVRMLTASPEVSTL